MGFRLQWVPPPAGTSTVTPWPTDLGAVPPSDIAAFLLERRRVDAAGPFEPVGQQNPPTLYFGNRGARSDPPPLSFGIDALVAYPETPPVNAPVNPWITVDDVLLSAANPGGPPPGSTHQYRVYSVDVIGRRSVAPTVGSVVRLEKHIAPPRPPGPEAPLPAGVVDANDTFLVGLGTRVRIRPTVYIVGEVAPRPSGYMPGVTHGSFAIEKRAGGHMFQLNFSNSFGTTMAQIARGGPVENDWYLGFNISRKFF